MSYGDSVTIQTGHGRMSKAILDSLHETGKFEIVHVGVGNPDISHLINPFEIQTPYPEYKINDTVDPFGKQTLLHTIAKLNFEILFIVADVWRLADIWDKVKQFQQVKNFKIVYYFPVDQPMRDSWLPVIKDCDFPITYSMYGYHEAKKKGIENIKYFRPPVSNAYYPLSPEERKEIKIRWFGTDDIVLIGWVGQNQIRKDPRRFLKAASLVYRLRPKVRFYLHTEVYNPQNGGDLRTTFADYGFSNQNVLAVKGEGVVVAESELNNIYNIMDIYVNNALGEVLSYTILEAQLAKTCVMASDNTSMSELISDGRGVPIKCGTQHSEITYLPIEENGKLIYIERPAISIDDCTQKMVDLIDDPIKRELIANKGHAFAMDFKSKSFKWEKFMEDVIITDKEVIAVEI